MNPRKLDRAFRSFLRSRGIDVATVESTAGLRAMLEFYAQERADGCDIARDQDMLLLQWGTYDRGQGKRFELDITRQVILSDETDDDATWQLHLTYRYDPSAQLTALGSGDKWCASPAELPAFERYIASSPAVSAVAGQAAAKIEILYECAG